MASEMARQRFTSTGPHSNTRYIWPSLPLAIHLSAHRQHFYPFYYGISHRPPRVVRVLVDGQESAQSKRRTNSRSSPPRRRSRTRCTRGCQRHRRVFSCPAIFRRLRKKQAEFFDRRTHADEQRLAQCLHFLLHRRPSPLILLPSSWGSLRHDRRSWNFHDRRMSARGGFLHENPRMAGTRIDHGGLRCNYPALRLPRYVIGTRVVGIGPYFTPRMALHRGHSRLLLAKSPRKRRVRTSHNLVLTTHRPRHRHGRTHLREYQQPQRSTRRTRTYRHLTHLYNNPPPPSNNSITNRNRTQSRQCSDFRHAPLYRH